LKKILLFISIATASLIGMLWLSSFGTVKYSMFEVIQMISGSLTGSRANIYMNLRLPRLLVAFLIGSGLAVGGNGLQLTLKNPLADPYIIGISAGASFGAVFSLFIKEMSRTTINMDMMAFLFAVFSAFLTYTISRRGGRIPITTLVLSGVIVSSLFNAAVTFLVVFAWRNVITLHFWSLGSLSGVTWGDVLKLLPAILFQYFVFTVIRRKMLILATGEEHAITVGVNPERIKFVVFFTVSIVSAIAVSTAGLIGFVGLIIPHMVRLAFGTDNRLNLPATALLGGFFLIVCDTFARTLFQPTELPIGAVTALVGAPVFIYLLRSKEVVRNG
jgi:iron complex transport system permease protein